MLINTICPNNWKDYELIDCGNFEKLERFGKYILIRPEPQAIWAKSLPEQYWQSNHHIKYIATGHSSGKWQKTNKNIPDSWQIQYKNPHTSLNIKLALTSFKHIGCFPEQASNWDYITASLSNSKIKNAKVLNLFAYTGIASLAASKINAEVWHVDAVKQIINWAKDNQNLSQVNNIHWIQEDAIKYLKRCIKRKVKFNGIIMDPPAYGIGPNKERWKLNENIQELIDLATQVLDTDYFIILNCYALGMSAISIYNILKNVDKQSNISVGELFVSSKKTDIKLPLGVYGRLTNLHKVNYT